MKPFTPMPQGRQDELMKAASTVVDMVGMQVDPDAALRKVAADSGMNEKEIDLVSHAVNNALAYDQVQTGGDDDRGEAFPLTNAETVKSDLYPDKKHDPEDNQGFHQPDAIDLTKSQQKNAADSYCIEENYLSADIPDPMAILKVAFAVEGSPEVAGFQRDPYAADRKMLDQLADLRLKVANAKDQVYQSVQSLRDLLAPVSCPVDMEQVKTAAAASGVPTGVIEFVTEAVGCDTAVKTASAELRLNSADSKALGLVEKIAEAIRVAGEASGGYTVLNAKRAAALQEKLAGSAQSAAAVGEMVGNLPETILGDDFNANARKVLDAEEEGEDSLQNAKKRPTSHEHERFVSGAKNRSLFNDVLFDMYVEGYQPWQVEEHFNDAIEGGFDTRAKLVSYIRNALASDGNVPMDTLLRADKGRKAREELV